MTKKFKARYTVGSLPTGPDLMAAIQRLKLENPVIALSAAIYPELFASPLFKLVTLVPEMSELRAGNVGVLLGCQLVTDAYEDKKKYPEGISIGVFKD